MVTMGFRSDATSLVVSEVVETVEAEEESFLGESFLVSSEEEDADIRVLVVEVLRRRMDGYTELAKNESVKGVSSMTMRSKDLRVALWS